MPALFNWRLWAALAALVVFAAWSAFVYRAGGAADRVALAEYKANQSEERLLADRARTLSTTKALNDAHAQTVAANAAAASAGDAAARLRAQLDKLQRTPRPGPGKQGADPLDLLIGMLTRHTGELVAVGRYADQLRISGLACERISDK